MSPRIFAYKIGHSLLATTSVDPCCPHSPASCTLSDVFFDCPEPNPFTLSSLYRPSSPFVPLGSQLLTFIEETPVPSLPECFQCFEDFLLYAATDCVSELFHRRPCNDKDHLSIVSCSPLRLDLGAYEHFVNLLRYAKLPVCQDCFIPSHQHHTETHSRCIYPFSVTRLAFLLWNHPSILTLLTRVLHRVVPCEEIEGVLPLERYVQFLGSIIDDKPLLLFLVGIYWFINESEGVVPS